MSHLGKVHPVKRSRHQQENHVRQIKVGREAKNFKLFMEGAKTKKTFYFFIFAIRRVQNYRVNTPLQNYQST